MSEETTHDKVLRILAGQSPDYFAFPNASAFVAEGLDPGEVADVLAELHAGERLEREELELDPDRAPVPGGYRLAAGGKKTRKRTAVKKTAVKKPTTRRRKKTVTETNDPSQPDPTPAPPPEPDPTQPEPDDGEDK